MIAAIDAIRLRYNVAISDAIMALDDFAAIERLPDLAEIQAQHVNAMQVINDEADRIINRRVAEEANPTQQAINIHISDAGDISIGDITQ